MPGSRASYRLVSAVVMIGAAVSGCGASGPDSVAGSGAARRPACMDVSGLNVASAGPLSMGSFRADSLRPQRGVDAGRKVWASSRRRGHDSAVLVVTDPSGRRTTQRRPPGTASIRGLSQFFPGVIQVLVSGTYRLDLTVGPDVMCVRVDYQV